MKKGTRSISSFIKLSREIHYIYTIVFLYAHITYSLCIRCHISDSFDQKVGLNNNIKFLFLYLCLKKVYGVVGGSHLHLIVPKHLRQFNKVALPRLLFVKATSFFLFENYAYASILQMFIYFLRLYFIAHGSKSAICSFLFHCV